MGKSVLAANLGDAEVAALHAAIHSVLTDAVDPVDHTDPSELTSGTRVNPLLMVYGIETVIDFQMPPEVAPS